jgi:glycosyltransferase involved in cell wall biosynthesis
VIRNTLSAKPSDIVIIQVSRLEPLKGHSVCLEALAHLRDKPGWVYWQVGGAQRPAERKYLGQLRADAARLGISDRVHFLGEREDVHELLSGADIFCQPNLQPEAFGISFVEALYAGVPAIGSAIGGVLEIVNDSCGRLVPAGDSAALSSAMRELIDNPDARAALGSAGPARARALCDPTVQMRRIDTLLASVTTGAHVLQS